MVGEKETGRVVAALDFQEPWVFEPQKALCQFAWKWLVT
jgi:hypothetical protein